MSTSQFEKINDFFDAYAQVFEQFDTKGMSRFYSIPCTFLSDEGANVFTENSKLEGLFNQGTVFYKQFGIVHARPQVWSKRFWTDRICKTRVNWQYFDQENQPVYDCDYQYILRQDSKSHWKIEVSVSVNEKQRMQEWLDKQKQK